MTTRLTKGTIVVFLDKTNSNLYRKFNGARLEILQDCTRTKGYISDTVLAKLLNNPTPFLKQSNYLGRPIQWAKSFILASKPETKDLNEIYAEGF